MADKQPTPAVMQRLAAALSHDLNAEMSALAAAAGVSRATLYRHFGGREDLVTATARFAITAMEEATDAVSTDSESYSAVFRQLVSVLVPLGASYRFVGHLEDRLEADLREAIATHEGEMAALIEAAKQAGEISAALPTWWVSQLFDATVWMAWSGIAAGELSRKGAPVLAFDTFWRGVKA